MNLGRQGQENLEKQWKEEDKVPVMLRLPESIHRRLVALVPGRATTLNNIINWACFEFVERQEQRVEIDDIEMVLRATGVDEEAINRAITVLRQRAIK